MRSEKGASALIDHMCDKGWGNRRNLREVEK